MIYWSTRSAQHVSGNILPIIRSVRLRYLQHMVSCCCGGQVDGERQRCTICNAAAHRLPAHHNNRIPYDVNISVSLFWWWAKYFPKHVELILLQINKSLLHLVGSSILLYLIGKACWGVWGGSWWCSSVHIRTDRWHHHGPPQTPWPLTPPTNPLLEKPVRQHSPHSAHSSPPDSPASQQLQQYVQSQSPPPFKLSASPHNTCPNSLTYCTLSPLPKTQYL